MIYYISNDQTIKDPSIEYCSVEESLKYLSTLEWVSTDIETTGLDRFINTIILLQLGDEHNQYVIDATTVDIMLYKEILEGKNLILQNAKFDIQFLYVVGIIPRGKIWDTMLAEQVLYNGYKPIANLGYLGMKYCDVILNKNETLSFIKVGYKITIAGIRYGAEDIQYLPEIKRQQEDKAHQKGIIRAIKLENAFVKVLAYVEYCGIHLDKDRWIKKYSSAGTLLTEKLNKLDDYVRDNKFTKYIDNQLNLFTTTRKVNINWGSTKQVIPLFEDIGINVHSEETKSGKSIGKDILARQKDDYDIIPLYLEHQTIKKDFSTYGASFLEHIHPVTGRIHSNFNQLQVTSRLSSSDPNLQNLPADKRTRSCFTAEDGNTLIDGDYKAQEDVIFVNNSEEENMIEFYKMADADGHSYVAKLCFPDELSTIELKDVKELRPDLRSIAKKAKFAIHYSGTGYTISKNLNLSEARGNEIYDSYLKAFPDIAKYLKQVMRTAFRRGYILISPVTGRKFWCQGFQRLRANDDYKAIHKFAKLACNYPIQGQSAELTKIGGILFFEWILDNGYFDIVKISNLVHDEVLTECPIEITEIVGKNLKDSLEKGAKPYCKIVPLKADLEISSHWVH